VDVRGDQANRIDNQIDVFGKTFLGLTVACARCHDHKFDAISAADYYALAGIVSGMRRDHAVVDTDRVQARYAEQARRQQREAERLMQQEWEGIAAWLNRPAASSPGPESVEPIAPAAQRERGLPASETADEPAAGRADSGPVAAMLRYLSDLPGEQVGRGPATGEDHPLRWINAYAKRPVGQPVGEWWDSFRQRILEQAQAAERFQAEATLVGDFSPSSRQSWWPSGLAFAEDAGERWLPTWLGEQVATTGRARWQAGQPGVWDSLRQGRSLAGTLRSPTFELTSDRLHLWVRGQDAKVRLVIDGYQMNLHHDLLFNQTLLTIQSPNFEWRTMQGDLGKYVGHRVYLELIDEGDGFVAIDQVWLGGDQPVVAPSPLLVQCCQSQASLQDLTQLAELTVAVLRAGATGQMIWPPEDDLPGPAVDQDADPREQKAGRREQKAGRVVVERGQSGGPITERVRETHGRVQRPSNLGRGRRTTVTPFDQALIQTWAWNWAPTAASPGDDWGAATLAADWAALDRQQAALAPPPVAVRKSWVAAGSEGWDHPLYIRGNHRNPGDLVPRGTLTALRTSGRQPERVGTSSGVTVAPEMRSRGGALDPSGRLAVAENIASPDNPLTARVMVNRIWLQLIGEGLVATPDDFGVMGAAPSHPELLDHLATQFVADGWSIKKMIRQIVLSQTYAMSVDGSPLAAERDPANQLRHRAQVRRLSGEVLRDAMLQISGRLDRQRHGPSVPTHVTELMQGRGRPESGPRDGNGRRSVYLEIRRNFLNPWMLVFDTPAPFSTMGKRTRSNVPAQALALLNDPLVHDLAATWAANVLTQAGTDRQRLEQMYWSALGRPLTDEEWPVFAAFLADFPAPDPGDEPAVAAQPTPERVAAWTQVAHALFNLKEFVFLN
jgi:hypothetical protein